MMDDLKIEPMTVRDVGLAVSLVDSNGDRLADLGIAETTQLIDWLTMWRDDLRETRRRHVGQS